MPNLGKTWNSFHWKQFKAWYPPATHCRSRALLGEHASLGRPRAFAELASPTAPPALLGFRLPWPCLLHFLGSHVMMGGPYNKDYSISGFIIGVPSFWEATIYIPIIPICYSSFHLNGISFNNSLDTSLARPMKHPKKSMHGLPADSPNSCQSQTPMKSGDNPCAFLAVGNRTTVFKCLGWVFWQFKG